MSELQVFVQDFGWRSQTLRFEAERLVVALADATGAREFAVRYQDIDLGGATPAEGPAPRDPLYLGLFASAAGLVLAAFSPPPWTLIAAGLSLIGALISLAPREKRADQAFPLRNSRMQKLVIWGDAQRDIIVAELASRWRVMRRRAVEVDFSAAPAQEIQRFQDLRARGIVNAEECAAAIKRISARRRPI